MEIETFQFDMLLLLILLLFSGAEYKKKMEILTVVRLNTRFPEMLLIFSKFGTYCSDFGGQKII